MKTYHTGDLGRYPDPLRTGAASLKRVLGSTRKAISILPRAAANSMDPDQLPIIGLRDGRQEL